jgi:para-nitrobenzyl esterase
MKFTPLGLMKSIGSLLLLAGLLSAPLAAQTHSSMPVQVKTTAGTIEGYFDVRTGLAYYLGVPFAKPPVGELRWKAPQPMDPWSGVKETKQFGHGPVQAIVFGDMGARHNGMSEDCLYLNVWTPADRNTKNLPVLVYFYGGGFVAGDGSEPRYDGASMARKGIVAVTVNYRLNIFGNFVHPELSAEAPYKASGNYGLLDQSAALRWVRDNIAAFGGDPKRVTIAGESAGSMSVSVQMASPLSRDLIAGAIGESGACISPTGGPVPLAEGEAQGLEFAKKAGNLTLKQLRAMSTKEIFELYSESHRFGFPVVIDGYLLPKSPLEIYRAGEQAHVPLLAGWNNAEIPGMAFMQGLPYTEENYVKKVKEAYPQDAETVLKLYPHGSDKEIEWSATALASDRFISYSTWKWTDLHRKSSGQPVYRYLYCKLMPPMIDHDLVPGLAGGTLKKQGGFRMPEPIGAPHACEIEYCMGNLDSNKDRAWTDEDRQVSETMQAFFAAFIKTGNPNGGGLPEWPAAAPQDPTPGFMRIDTVSKAEKALDDARYEFLDRSYRNR